MTERNSGHAPACRARPNTIGGRTIVIGTTMGQTFGGLFARPLAAAVMRRGRRRIRFDPRPTVDHWARRRQRRDVDQHGRRLPAGHTLRPTWATPRQVHLVELPVLQGPRQAGQMVDDLLSGDRGRQAVGIGHVAEDQACAPSAGKWSAFEAVPHQARNLIAPGRQRGDQVRPDEATCSGN